MTTTSTPGQQLPNVHTTIPGPQSQAWVDRLAARECPAITARRARRASTLGLSDTDPIVWEKAIGANVYDVDGNIFVDVTAGFGVSSAGHRAPSVTTAAKDQLDQLTHAMGDAFPDPKRIQLLEKLAEITGFERSILGCSGSDAVEASLKTALLATGRSTIMAFSNSYHGLAFGALPTTDYKSSAFRKPFQAQLANHVIHYPFAGELPTDFTDCAAVIVEPIQGRGGIKVPPNGWLAELTKRAQKAGTVVIFDEIYTGFGRTGTMFAFQHESLQGTKPDILCLGKAMGGGFPISACIGTAKVMDAWGASFGEAIHTQTFLGNPLGCSMALASIALLQQQLPEVQEKSQWLQNQLNQRSIPFRGRGLLLGLELPQPLLLCRQLLEHGFIALPAGPAADVLVLCPPFSITYPQLNAFLKTLDGLLSCHNHPKSSK